MTYCLRLVMALTFQRFVVARHSSFPKVSIFVPSFYFQMKSLDNDIHTTLAMLRRHINALQSPIYRLPSDVFSEVASHLQPETDLIRFTHASHLLRAALLSDPSLWSYIDPIHEERAQAFLQRSKEAPLHVNRVKTEHQKFPLLPSHMARLVSLEMCNCESQKESILSQPMPALRSLHIDGSNHYEGVDGGVENSPSWSLASVTSLIVNNAVSIRLRVPHLTRFGFSHGGEETMIGPLLDFLDNCPLLEDLYISYNSESSYSRDRLVSLPNLRNCTQRTYSDHHSLGLFNMLSLPPTCSVTVRRVVRPSVIAADVVPPFRNPDHLDGITRIKLRARGRDISDGTTVTLELVNAKGAKVCLEKILYGGPTEFITSDESKLAHMRCLQNFNPRSVGILCLEGYGLQDDQGQFVVDEVRNAMEFSPSLTTIILSFTAVEPCLLALDIDPHADNHPRHSPFVHTLVIHSDFYYVNWPDTLQTLLAVAQRRKAAGCPFRSVSLFLLEDPQSGRILDELRECIGGFEITVGDEVLGWDVDRYFLAGLDHVRERRDVWCDQVDDHIWKHLPTG